VGTQQLLSDATQLARAADTVADWWPLYQTIVYVCYTLLLFLLVMWCIIMVLACANKLPRPWNINGEGFGVFQTSEGAWIIYPKRAALQTLETTRDIRILVTSEPTNEEEKKEKRERVLTRRNSW
jgi:hypothetical protein